MLLLRTPSAARALAGFGRQPAVLRRGRRAAPAHPGASHRGAWPDHALARAPPARAPWARLPARQRQPRPRPAAPALGPAARALEGARARWAARARGLGPGRESGAQALLPLNRRQRSQESQSVRFLVHAGLLAVHSMRRTIRGARSGSADRGGSQPRRLISGRTARCGPSACGTARHSSPQGCGSSSTRRWSPGARPAVLSMPRRQPCHLPSTTRPSQDGRRASGSGSAAWLALIQVQCPPGRICQCARAEVREDGLRGGQAIGRIAHALGEHRVHQLGIGARAEAQELAALGGARVERVLVPLARPAPWKSWPCRTLTSWSGTPGSWMRTGLAHNV